MMPDQPSSFINDGYQYELIERVSRNTTNLFTKTVRSRNYFFYS